MFSKGHFPLFVVIAFVSGQAAPAQAQKPEDLSRLMQLFQQTQAEAGRADYDAAIATAKR